MTSPIMSQTWEKLLFAHWPCNPAQLQAQLPPQLIADTFQGQAWLSVVPFKLRYQLKPLAFTSYWGEFLELNLRTYVRYGNQTGVYFFCLDASDWLSVIGARLGFHLNYNHAVANMMFQNGIYHYSSRRSHPGMPIADVTVAYEPTGAPNAAEPDSLEDWLTNRALFFSTDKKGRVYRGRIHHAPWRLQPAKACFQTNTLGVAHGFDLSKAPAVVQYCDFLQVDAWPVARV